MKANKKSIINFISDFNQSLFCLLKNLQLNPLALRVSKRELTLQALCRAEHLDSRHHTPHHIPVSSKPKTSTISTHQPITFIHPSIQFEVASIQSIPFPSVIPCNKSLHQLN